MKLNIPEAIKQDFLLYPKKGRESDIIPKIGLKIQGKFTNPEITYN